MTVLEPDSDLERPADPAFVWGSAFTLEVELARVLNEGDGPARMW